MRYRKIVKWVISRKKMFLKQTNKLLPRIQLYLPPHRHRKFPLNQNQQKGVRELEKIK
jgi:hypothetical protein